MIRALFATAATLAVVVSAGFGVQAAALGRPTDGTRELIWTLSRLQRYHRSTSLMELDGRRYTSSCADRWFPHRRVANVVLGGGEVLPEVDDHLLRRGNLAASQFELAGCPRPLDVWLSTQLAQHGRVELLSAHGRRRAFELLLPQAKPPVALVVGDRSHLPVEIELAGARDHGQSDVHYPAVR